MLFDEPAAPDGERIFQAPTVELTLRPVLARIAARVADKAIGQRFDEAGTIAPPRRLHGLLRRRPYHPQVVAVQCLRGELHGLWARDARSGRDRRKRCVLAVAVVLTDVDHRQVHDFREIKALKEIALVAGAVTEKAHGHVPGTAQRQAGAGGRGNAAADDAEAANQSVLQVHDIHRPGPSRADPRFASEQLVEQALRVEAKRERVTMPAVGSRHPVCRVENAGHADSDGLLTRVEMRRPVDLALEDTAVTHLLELP